MNKLKWQTVNPKYTDILCILSVLFIFILKILLLFTSSLREENILSTYLIPLIVAMVVYLFVRIGLPRSLVAVFPPVFALWYLLTRIMNGDWYLHQSHSLVYMVILSCCVLFFIPFLMRGEQRSRFLKAFALIYSLAFSAIAWVAVVAALTGNPWVNPLDGVNILGVNDVYANPYRLNILGIHPNISAIFFYTSLSLLLYLFFQSEKVWIRLCYSIPAVGLYIAICMTGSISAIFVTGIIIGLVVFAFVFHSGKVKKNRVVLAIFAMLATIAIVVASYPLIIQWTSGINEKIEKEALGFDQVLLDCQQLVGQKL